MRDRFVVVWRVTEACNLGCGFCKYDRSQDFPRKSADPRRVLALGELFAERQRETGLPVHVSFLGGEPLLWPPLCEVARDFHERLGLSTGVTTNGTALASERTRSWVLEHMDELSISIDGFAALHDRLRGWPGGFDCLARSIRALAGDKRRTGRGPLLRANVVLMRDNAGELATLCRALADFGIEEITFNQLGGNDRPEFFALHRLLPEQADRLGAEIDALRAAGVKLRAAPSYLERIRASARGRRLPIADCSPGERFLFLDEDGVAAPCSFTADALGLSLASHALAGLSAEFRGAIAKRSAPSCGDCPSTQVFGKFG